MPGWFFSGHLIVNVPKGFFPFLRHPHWVRRPRGFGYPPPGSCACTSGTSLSWRRHLPLFDPGGGGKDVPWPRRACSYPWRLVYHPGGEWMSFHSAWGRWPSRSGSEWDLVGPHWGRAGFCPAAGRRLPWMESRLKVGLPGVACH